MFDNPFLIDLKKSLKAEKKILDDLNNKIDLCILNGDFDHSLELSVILNNSVDRYKMILNAIKEMECN